MGTIAKYASLVRFAHTVFAMPFALAVFVYALWYNDLPFEWLLILKVILAMVFARNAAMGFNRYVDRDIDARNQRTASREIPSGVISARNALWFVIINSLFFLLTTLWINMTAFVLSPVALMVLLGYSSTKRFTAWCHVVLGVALGIAPIGAYIAVTGTIAVLPILVSALVISWTAGFDIIYSLQDIDFDRNEGLHSIPVRFGIKKALVISAILHAVSIWALVLIGINLGGGIYYIIGAVIFTGLLIFQHLIVSPANLSRIGLAFGTVNGIASIVFCVFMIAEMLLM